MAVTYEVAQRGGPFVRWGFCVPRPPVPVRHPVFLRRSNRPLIETSTDELLVGTFAAGAPHWSFIRPQGGGGIGRSAINDVDGVWTGGISDCMLVCAAYFEGPPRRWSWFCFQHVQGGG